MYTCNGAYAIFEEEEKGTLEVGKLADVIILDGDIMMTKKEKIQDMSVLSTIKSGELIYNRLWQMEEGNQWCWSYIFWEKQILNTKGKTSPNVWEIRP